MRAWASRNASIRGDGLLVRSSVRSGRSVLLMLIKEARAIAADWVRGREPRAAFYTGSSLDLADRAELSAESDLDIVVVSDGPAPDKIGKVVHRGVRLDVSFLDRRELANPDAIARIHYLAPSFRSESAIIVDADGELRAVHDHVAPIFGRSDVVWGRCENVLSRMMSGLSRVGELASWPTQLLGWLFPISLPTQLLLVAGCRNPTVRLRYLRTRELLVDHQLTGHYPALLELLGCLAVTPATVLRHLDTLGAVFDATTDVPSDLAFAADLSADSRPVAIDGTRRLVQEGDHREAVFWLMVTFARCQVTLDLAPDPGSADQHRPLLDAAAADLLGVSEPADLQRRARSAERWLPELSTTARKIITELPAH